MAGLGLLLASASMSAPRLASTGALPVRAPLILGTFLTVAFAGMAQTGTLAFTCWRKLADGDRDGVALGTD